MSGGNLRINIPPKALGLTDPLSLAISPNPYSPYSIHSATSPLDQIAGHYVELDDLKHDKEWLDQDRDINTKEPRGLRNSERPESSALGGPPPPPPPPTAAPRPASIPAAQPGNGNQDDDRSGWWLFEILAWFLSAIALLVITMTISMTDQKPLPQWPMNITLNSFVSFMSTILKASLIVPVAEGISQLKWVWFKEAHDLGDIQTFDESSRGSWGSLKLLLGTKGVHLAKLGALITIVTLGIDPFIQQVITYPNRIVPSTQYNSTVPIAGNFYNDYAFGSIMALGEPTLSMKAAINNGVFDTNDNPQNDFGVDASCATGNCTWPDTYHSLAVCSKCANTTTSINKTCTDASGVRSYCEYSLPNGLWFNGLQRGRLYMNSTGSLDTINFNNTQSTISSISTIRGLHDLSSTSLLGVVSNECVLYFCVNEYRSVVEDGEFKEEVVASYTGDSDPKMDQNITITVPGSPDKNYTVSGTAWFALSNHFSSYWTGNVTGDVGEISTSRSDDVLNALYSLGEDGSGTGAQKVGGENNTIYAVAASMTRLLRLSSYGASQINGTVNTMETFVHVRWPWMLLPIILEALAFVFLMCTIIKSKNNGIAVWKSSTLPLLQGKYQEVQDRCADKHRR